MQVLGRATGPELGQQVHAACAGPVLIPIACAQPYLGRPVPGEDEDRHRRSSFNRRGGGIGAIVAALLIVWALRGRAATRVWAGCRILAFRRGLMSFRRGGQECSD